VSDIELTTKKQKNNELKLKVTDLKLYLSKIHRELIEFLCECEQLYMLQVCNETDAQLIMSKYKKNTMKRKRKALYRDKKIKCFNLRVLVSN